MKSYKNIKFVYEKPLKINMTHEMNVLIYQ